MVAMFPVARRPTAPRRCHALPELPTPAAALLRFGLSRPREFSAMVRRKPCRLAAADQALLLQRHQQFPSPVQLNIIAGRPRVCFGPIVQPRSLKGDLMRSGKALDVLPDALLWDQGQIVGHYGFGRHGSMLRRAGVRDRRTPMDAYPGPERC